MPRAPILPIRRTPELDALLAQLRRDDKQTAADIIKQALREAVERQGREAPATEKIKPASPAHSVQLGPKSHSPGSLLKRR